MKVGDCVVNTICKMTGKVIAILEDNTGIVEVKRHRIYVNFNYWAKTNQ